MVEPYFADDTVTLYLGDSRDILPALGVTADLVLADPPYGETSLKWDRWPDGWVKVAADVSRSLWCFGSMRMFLQHGQEFEDAGWQMSQDVVWQKPLGTGLATDRFRRVHEHALHWYQGPWNRIYHDAPRERWYGANAGRRSKGGSKGAHLGEAGDRRYVDDGTRLRHSVIPATNLRQRALHPTEKPVGLCELLIAYACPPGGLVVDPFVGSGAVLEAARLSGRRAIGIEGDKKYADRAARRLSQLPLLDDANSAETHAP